MKRKLLLIITVLMFALPVYADDLCTDIAEYAEKVMTYRQTGKSIVEAMKELPIIERVDFPEDAKEQFRKDTIVEAYGKPFFSGAEYKKRAIVGFMNDYYIGCSQAK
jgi:hypothetical protein